MPSPRPQWLKFLPRLGYASRGLIYLVIGYFAMVAAVGYSGKTDTRGALQTILHSGLGNIASITLIVGLVCYSTWRLVQALVDTDEHGWTPHGLLVRGGLMVSGIIYSTLALYSLSLYLGTRDSGSDLGTQFASAFAGFIGSPMTAALLAAIFAGAGIAHFYKAFATKYAKHFKASKSAMVFIHPIAIIGLAARGTVFLVVAFLLFYRGLNSGADGGQPGLMEALDFIHGLPAGAVLLAAIGGGLMAFSAYSFTQAVWRRIALNAEAGR